MPASLQEFIKALSPTSPNLQYTLQKGRCLLTTHFVLVIWRARYTAGGFPNRWIRGGVERTRVWQMQCRPFGGSGAAQ